jgi:hypothetical protein
VESTLQRQWRKATIKLALIESVRRSWSNDRRYRIRVMRVLSRGLTCLSLCAGCIVAPSLARAQTTNPAKGENPSFETLLQRAASATADWCADPGDDSGRTDETILEAAAAGVVDALNEPSRSRSAQTDDGSATLRDVLAKFNDAGSRINSNWPAESRFRADALTASPLLLMKATFRNRWALYAFGVKDGAMGEQGARRRWQVVQAASDEPLELRLSMSLDVFPINRGPAGRARFLTRRHVGGCAGSVGVAYRLLEWDPGAFGTLSSLVEIDGAETQEEATKEKNLSASFPPVGDLHVTGTTITLPYCWWSVLDTWHNPSLCAADSFDVSGDHVLFKGRATNRPDLVPIAHAIKHAQAHEYRAVLAYCRSAEIANRIVRDVPPYIFAETLTVKSLGPGKETVEFGADHVFRFDVERVNGGWTITKFRIDRQQ